MRRTLAASLAHAQDADTVTLNFVNADIDAVVKAIGEITGRNFLVDPRVKGTVNIVSARPVAKALVYPTLLSALRMQGFAAVEADGVVKIVPEAEAKTLAEKRLRSLDARGSTDLAAGWQAGAGQFLGNPSSAQPAIVDADPARVLLLTDGLANAGETNPDTLAATAADLRRRGVVTSTFGVGADFDEQLMSRIASAGGGHFYFIEQAAQMVTEDDATASTPCGPDVGPVVESVRKYLDAGYTHLYFHQIGPDQDGFFRFWSDELQPALADLASS